jgi:hypothetical protein
MCQGDDPNCVDFEIHKAYRSALSAERRAFLKSGFAATSGAAALATTGISLVSRLWHKVRRPGRRDSRAITTSPPMPRRCTGATSAKA